MKRRSGLIIVVFIISMLVACDKPEEEITATDVDGNVYNAVTIGTQVWMAENLKVTHYSDGTKLPELKVGWIGTSSGAYCYYNNEMINADTSGVLYNWFAIDDSRSLAPEGWHVPTDAEWKALEMHLGMSQLSVDSVWYRGVDEGSQLKSTAGWSDGGNGSNTSGFNAKPGGYHSSGGDLFGSKTSWACFMSISETEDNLIYGRILMSDKLTVYRASFQKMVGVSVRCVKD